MDTTEPDVCFDADGVSSHRLAFDEVCAPRLAGAQGGERLGELADFVALISAGRGKPCDCVIGVSGGIDTTYLTLQAVCLGLRPLLVHFDSGCDSELAVGNARAAHPHSSPLNYLPYVYADAKQKIAEAVGWRDYGGKHYESVFTRYFQGYYLPHKFGFDKRPAHDSSLILSGQLTRYAALALTEPPNYPEQPRRQDHEFIAKNSG